MDYMWHDTKDNHWKKTPYFLQWLTHRYGYITIAIIQKYVTSKQAHSIHHQSEELYNKE